MKLSQSSELMKNQKYAQALKPDTSFKALQTQEGSSLFFSIGPDGAFYISRERQGDTLGWNRINLTQFFTPSYGNTPVVMRTFDVAQDLTAGTIDLVIVFTAQGQDHLFISLNNPNSDSNWETASPAWTELIFDDKANMGFSGLPIPDVYLAQTGSTEFLIVDILTDNTTHFITRYFVDPTGTKTGTGQVWNLHTVAANLEAGTITSAMGRKGGETFDGIYTLGAITSEAEIIYTPMYDKHVVGRIPSAISIALPDGASASNTAMAVVATSAPYTDLFIIANGSLYYLGYSDQVNLAVPTKVYTHKLLNGVTTMHVDQYNGKLVLWGLTKDATTGIQKIFVMRCTAGNETIDSTYDATGQGWKCPIPILTNVLNVSPFINNQTAGSVIFAHLTDDQGTLVQLSQDPATSSWHRRSILIPEVTITNAYDVNTYTTHLSFTDDNLVPQAGCAVNITATHPVSVYINDLYYTLSTDTALSVNTDNTGVITIIQEVDSIGAAGYFVTIGDLQNVTVNPLTDLFSKLSSFGADPNADPSTADPTKLDVTVTDEYGTQSKLVAPGISDDQKKLSVAGISQFLAANSNIDQSGAVQDDSKSGAASPAASKPAPVAATPATSAIHPPAIGGFISWIETEAGDFWQWMKTEANEFGSIVMNVVDGVVNFVITIGTDVYHFVIKCMRDIADGIHTMLNAVETAFEDMVKWLGMIFSFGDIKTTHHVLHKFFSLYISDLVTNVDSLQGDVANAFEQMLTQVQNMTGLPDMSQTYSAVASTTPPTPGSDSASANWGNHQFKSNSGNSDASLAPDNSPDDPTNGLIDQLIGDLEAAGPRFEAVKDQIVNLAQNAHTMEYGDIIKQMVGIILEVYIEGTETLVSMAVTVLTYILKSVAVGLDAPMDIPVISYLFKKAVGEELTALGLMTFLMAIPATVVIKIVRGAAPFPADDQSTQDLLNAQTLDDVRTVLLGTATPAAASVANLSAPAANLAAVPGATPPPPSKAMVALTDVTSIAAAVGSIVMSAILLKSIPPMPDAEGKLPDATPFSMTDKILTVVNSCAYICYASPDILVSVAPHDEDWTTTLNGILTTAACIKACVDGSTYRWTRNDDPAVSTTVKTYTENVAPWLDFFLNMAWLAPPMGILIKRCVDKKVNANDAISFAANVAFDLSGILALPTLFCKKITDAKARAIAVGACVAVTDVMNLVWGGGAVCLAFDTWAVAVDPFNPTYGDY